MRDPSKGQIIVDTRTLSADLGAIARSVEEYAGRRLDTSAYEKSLGIVNDAVRSSWSALSEEDKFAHKILIDDDWMRYTDLRNPSSPCPGENEALAYIAANDRLHPTCERCRKVLVFDLDPQFLRRITEEFLVKQLMFEFKIYRDLGVLVAYCCGDERREEVMAYLDDFMKSNGLAGRLQWRIGGKYLQDAAPYLFKSAKILSYEI
jgi:hypothetical protein